MVAGLPVVIHVRFDGGPLAPTKTLWACPELVSMEHSYTPERAGILLAPRSVSCRARLDPSA